MTQHLTNPKTVQIYILNYILINICRFFYTENGTFLQRQDQNPN